MARLKLPSIKSRIASDLKPVNAMVNSITSKLRANVSKMPKLPKFSVAKMSAVKMPKTSNIKMPQFVFKK